MIKSARFCLVLALFAAFATPVRSQGQKQTTAQPTVKEVSAEQVIGFLKAKVSEDIIISQIRKRGAFDPTPEQIVQMKQAGASDNIIRAMMDPQSVSVTTPVAPAAPPTPATVTPQPQVATPAPAPVRSPAVVSPETQQTASLVPDEQGVYWLKEGKELVRMEGITASNVRTGSTLVSGLTAGIKRARINAQLKGARSEFRIKERLPQFYFYLAEGASVTDFLLLRVAQRLDVRQIEVGEKTFWKAQAGVDHAKQAEFSYKRIKSRLYLVIPNHELEPGEYVFYGSTGVSAIEIRNTRFYDFGIDP